MAAKTSGTITLEFAMSIFALIAGETTHCIRHFSSGGPLEETAIYVELCIAILTVDSAKIGLQDLRFSLQLGNCLARMGELIEVAAHSWVLSISTRCM
jgi:hypothetical protein